MMIITPEMDYNLSKRFHVGSEAIDYFTQHLKRLNRIDSGASKHKNTTDP